MLSWSTWFFWCCQGCFLLSFCWYHLQGQKVYPNMPVLTGWPGGGGQNPGPGHAVAWKAGTLLWYLPVAWHLGHPRTSLLPSWRWMTLPTNGLVVKWGLRSRHFLNIATDEWDGYLGPSSEAHIGRVWSAGSVSCWAQLCIGNGPTWGRAAEQRLGLPINSLFELSSQSFGHSKQAFLWLLYGGCCCCLCLLVAPAYKCLRSPVCGCREIKRKSREFTTSSFLESWLLWPVHLLHNSIILSFPMSHFQGV